MRQPHGGQGLRDAVEPDGGLLGRAGELGESGHRHTGNHAAPWPGMVPQGHLRQLAAGACAGLQRPESLQLARAGEPRCLI